MRENVGKEARCAESWLRIILMSKIRKGMGGEEKGSDGLPDQEERNKGITGDTCLETALEPYY